MGSKRPHDGDEPMQLPYKYSKQSTTDEKLNSFADEKLAPITSIHPCNECHVRQNGHEAPNFVDPLEVKSNQEVHNVADRGLFRFQWIIDSHGDDRDWYRELHRSISPDYLEYDFPRRAPLDADNTLSSFLDRYPRKLVPVGANYQAELPEWEPTKAASRRRLGAPNSDPVPISDEEKKFMGICVIRMPDSLPAQNCIPAGSGRKDCDCEDRGSVRCVRQHVKAARDKLLRSLGEDKFRELGFVNMGEDISRKWSEEEEQIYHDVVFSNPASLGKDFWPCLSEEFPTRSKREIVSYYFNVFMLRKRAAQNRSRFLDIDSDDDEWHPGHGRSCNTHFVGEDDDLMSVHDDDSSDEDDDSDDDNSDGDEGTNSGDADKEEPSKLNMGYPHKADDLFPGNHDDSCVSFEYQSGMDDSTPPETGVPTKPINGLRNDNYFSSHRTESEDGLHHGFLDDSNHFRQWDQEFSSGLDNLLPTWNIIEEIFGPGSWDEKPGQD
uniref:Myb-like domain-containing protein n=1 Tax=Kalanchoe fedtschenkoi TaxID=63787 RepID=A0A7N0ZSB0_KALFE